METLPTIWPLVQSFSSCFTRPTFLNFALLLLAWIDCGGMRTVTHLLQWPTPLPPPLAQRNPIAHWSNYHSFFSRAKWKPDDLSEGLARRLTPFVPADSVVLLIDDTLTRRFGRRLPFISNHKDAARSGKTTVYTSGYKFVVLSLWIPYRWSASGGIAVPIAWRLHRPKKTCEEGTYKTPSALALELVHLARDAWPDRLLEVVVDNGFTTKEFFNGVPERVIVHGRIRKTAELCEVEIKQPAKGRRRKYGEALPSPEALADDERWPWQEMTVCLYGRPQTLWVKALNVVWKNLGHTAPQTLVLTRDPRGQLADRYYLVNVPDYAADVAVERRGQRWSEEEMFRGCKQELRLESWRNGHVRHNPVAPEAEATGPRETAGAAEAKESETPTSSPEGTPSAPTGKRVGLAVERTAPMAFMAYAVVVLWYLHHGNPEEDIARVKARSPWYPTKATISFTDMRAAFRRHMHLEHFSPKPADTASAQTPPDLMARYGPLVLDHWRDAG